MTEDNESWQALEDTFLVTIPIIVPAAAAETVCVIMMDHALGAMLAH